MGKTTRKPETQSKRPGVEADMQQKPEPDRPEYRPADKLKGRVALITGGDSGIGRAIALIYAREGADVAIVYKSEDQDAKETQRMVEERGGRCLVIDGDVGDSAFCDSAVEQTVREFGKLDILVNNAAEQHPQNSLLDISDEQLERTFRTNIFGYFYMARAALKHLKAGGVIINTTSVTAYRGSKQLLDYSSTKGAIVAFTRSLALSLAEQQIRVNGVAPGPIWTPLIPSTFPKEKVESFGADTPMQRPGQPDEVASCYVFLAAVDSSYITGQILHPNGGEVVNA